MFDPWLRPEFGRADNVLGGVRLLVLGESHYCDGDDAHLVGKFRSGFTTEVVEKYALAEPQRFFTALSSLIAGRPKHELSASELGAIWDAVAFYNYVPRCIAKNARPNAQEWRDGAAPFRALLAREKPNAVLVCGYDLWWWMVQGASSESLKEPWTLDFYDVHGVPCARMQHPSRAFAWQKWRPTLDALMARARGELPRPHGALA